MDQPLDLSQRDMDRMSRIETEDCYRYNDNMTQSNFPPRHHSPVDSSQMQHHSPVQNVYPPRYQSPVQNACPPIHQSNVQLPSLVDHYVPYGVPPPPPQNPIQYMPNYYSDYLLLDQSGAQLNKRSSFHDIRGGSLTHPKRRKTEAFNQPISKSTSDNNLSVSQEKELSPKSAGFFRPGFPMSSHEQNVNSSADMYIKSIERRGSLTSSDPTMHMASRTGSPMAQQGNVLNFQGSRSCSDSPARLSASSSCAGSPISVDASSPPSPSEEETEAQKERNKTIKYMERLPKKRISARNLSQESYKESSDECRQVRHASYTTVNQRNNANNAEEITKGPEIQNDLSSLNTRDQSLINGAKVGSTKPPSPDSCKEQKEPRTKTPIDANSLKKDMIREIEDEEMREKAGEKKPSDFCSYLYSAKLRHRNNGDDTNSGDAKMTALDYFISKTLSLRQDRPFKSRNQHIHQIIRGEKPGKLCLLDMVELQVEIGLA